MRLKGVWGNVTANRCRGCRAGWGISYVTLGVPNLRVEDARNGTPKYTTGSGHRNHSFLWSWPLGAGITQRPFSYATPPIINYTVPYVYSLNVFSTDFVLNSLHMTVG